ncbi:SDR family oxidoreductase [Oleiharenicola lentus]|uniref:SDR family oxidoreductase n=1 Tax=Oleiharenicola lentus TaxID=2508720 RepID=UPI003F6820A5
MIAITAATGQLGRLVIDQILAAIPANQLVAVVRNPAKAADLAARGVTVRAADYNNPAALETALVGVEKLLLISSNEIGQRAAQHTNVINAARRAGVKVVVYTSLLHADTTTLDLAPEHLATEAALRNSGLSHIILRNGWYVENHTGSVGAAVANGALIGSAGEGRISAAARADYAAAAVVALTGRAETGRTYELAGDRAITLAELAAEISRQTGKPIPYRNLLEADYAAILAQVGLSADFAKAIARWDVDASQGALLDEDHQLSRLIGRPTTTLADCVAQALAV